MRKNKTISAAERIKEIMPDVNIACVTSYDKKFCRQAAHSIGIEHYCLKSDLFTIKDILESDKKKSK